MNWWKLVNSSSALWIIKDMYLQSFKVPVMQHLCNVRFNFLDDFFLKIIWICEKYVKCSLIDEPIMCANQVYIPPYNQEKEKKYFALNCIFFLHILINLCVKVDSIVILNLTAPWDYVVTLCFIMFCFSLWERFLCDREDLFIILVKY